MIRVSGPLVCLSTLFHVEPPFRGGEVPPREGRRSEAPPPEPVRPEGRRP